MVALVGSENLPNLETLDLRGNYSSITNSGLTQIAAMPQAARLRRLNLSQCEFDNEGILALARSRYLQNLEQLDLAAEESYEQQNGISGREFAVELGNPTCLPALRCLDISHQMIGDAGIEALARSPRFANFRKLVLRHEGISDEGLIALANTPFPPRLQELDICRNAFGDAGFAALCQSPVAPGVEQLHSDVTPNTGDLLASSRFENLLELRVFRLNASLLESLAASKTLKSLRRLIFQAGDVTTELLQRKWHQPVYLLHAGLL
jgi:hypothetical protein